MLFWWQYWKCSLAGLFFCAVCKWMHWIWEFIFMLNLIILSLLQRPTEKQTWITYLPLTSECFPSFSSFQSLRGPEQKYRKLMKRPCEYEESSFWKPIKGADVSVYQCHSAKSGGVNQGHILSSSSYSILKESVMQTGDLLLFSAEKQERWEWWRDGLSWLNSWPLSG